MITMTHSYYHFHLLGLNLLTRDLSTGCDRCYEAFTSAAKLLATGGFAHASSASSHRLSLLLRPLRAEFPVATFSYSPDLSLVCPTSLAQSSVIRPTHLSFLCVRLAFLCFRCLIIALMEQRILRLRVDVEYKCVHYKLIKLCQVVI